MFGHYGNPNFKQMVFNINEAYDGYDELPKCFYLAPLIINKDKYTTKWNEHFKNERSLFKFEVDLSKVLIINSLEEYLKYLDIYGVSYEDNYNLYSRNYNNILSKIELLKLNYQKKYDKIISIIKFFKNKYDLIFDINMSKKEINKIFRTKFNVNTNDMKLSRYISCKINYHNDDIKYLQHMRLLLIYIINEINTDQYKILFESGKIKLCQDLKMKFESVKRLDPIKIKEAGFNGYYLTENIFTKLDDIKEQLNIVYIKITQYQNKILHKLEEINISDLDDYCKQLTLYITLNFIIYCKYEQLIIWNDDISFIKQI